MNSKKIKVAYYDYVERWKPKAMKESATVVNWLIREVEKDGEGEVVIATVDVLLNNVRHPYDMFIYGILNKKQGKIDKVIFLTIEKFGMEKVKELYEQLNELGISLEFIEEGPVDEQFIEAYTFVKQRKAIWTVRKFELIGPISDEKIILHKDALHPNATIVSSIYRTKN